MMRQRVGREWRWRQITEAPSRARTIARDAQNLEIARSSELHQDLPAHAARWCGQISFGGNYKVSKTTDTTCNSASYRRALGAQPGGKGRILHVASDRNAAVFAAHRSADAKIRIGCIRLRHNAPRGLLQLNPNVDRHATTSLRNERP